MKLRISIFFLVLFAAHPALGQDTPKCENDYAILDAAFEGARMSVCEANRKSFTIRIDPENKPINPSPWYAFRVTPKQAGDLKIVMRYSDAKHRYWPKRSDDVQNWRVIEPSRVRERRRGKKVVLRVAMVTEPFIVAGQELLLTGGYEAWSLNASEKASLEYRTIGQSVEGRPIKALISAPAAPSPDKEFVLLIGRQHPPELTGAFAMLPFLDTVFGDTELARQFRARFHIISVPLMNPDGVANGHWRHNMNGVDLNRDWGPFTQPETQAVKQLLDEIDGDENSNLRLMLDFHSTNRNVFYTQSNDEETNPPGYTLQWLAGANERLEGYEYEHALRPHSDLATSKNYIFGRFGAPGITYELGDHTDRALIRSSAIIFAEEMMKTLLASEND